MWKLLKSELNYNKIYLLMFFIIIPVIYVIFSGDLFKKEKPTDIKSGVIMDVNNLKVFPRNDGPIREGNFRTPDEKVSRFVLASAGIWVGGKVNGEVQTRLVAHDSDFLPGNITEEGKPAESNLKFRMYKINKGDGADNPDWVDWPVELGAPVDEKGNPKVLGDQTLWTIYNDATPVARKTHLRGSKPTPIGLEIQQTTFGFNREGPLGNTIFVKYTITNKWDNTIEDAYISIWADPDIWDAKTDIVGCTPEENFAYCYNSRNFDQYWGLEPPALGFLLLKSPVDDDGVQLNMTAFNKYSLSTDPQTTMEAYNYMTGKHRQGAAITHPLTNTETTFPYDGDPVKQEGWLDPDPTDRRLLISSGPFTFAPGDTQEIVSAIFAAKVGNNIQNLKALYSYKDAIKNAYETNFNIPAGKPIVTTADMYFKKKMETGKITVILLFIIVMMNIIIGMRYKERRDRQLALLPVTLRQIAIARILSVTIPTFIIITILGLIPLFYQTLPFISYLKLISGFGSGLVVFSAIFILTDLFYEFIRRNKTGVITTLIGIFALLNMWGYIRYMDVKRMEQTQKLLFKFQQYNPFGGELGWVNLLLLGGLAAYITILTFQKRKSYL